MEWVWNVSMEQVRNYIILKNKNLEYGIRRNEKSISDLLVSR